MGSMSYRPTIGLEIHAELSTSTKMFCSCKNDADETRPNVNVCPICLAHPGTLPTINKEAVRHVLSVGAAVEGTLADFSEFDRKSYFYPDIPKGYQISQYEYPLVKGGELNKVAITRVHLEEDTARSTHAEGRSLVDFNRAGIPLMELVTEPVIHDAETAGNFARLLQLLLRSLGASAANLEKGEMRIEANVLVSEEEGAFGTKVEIKNLNSFRSVERAIAYEVARQTAALEKGEVVRQETRGWDEAKEETFHQRFKEGSADYRYFPEPDLPKLVLREVPEFTSEVIKASLPELASGREARYAAFGLKIADAAYLAADNKRSSFFDAVAATIGNDAKTIMLAANYFVSDLAGLAGKAEPAAFAKLAGMLARGEVSSRAAKDILVVMKGEGGEPEAIAKANGLLQVGNPEVLRAVVGEVLVNNEGVVADYRRGKEVALQYLVGAAMKASKGAGNPGLLRAILIEEIGRG